ncbi:uncharacterized protein LOC116308652, partial [Actinia tenebrosa]|uniref:Uncharacterized protein LOC116308652 n=1 Tax=Actinia tenebrosa TaxID=6105 RepID=A0A6P8JF35_ACTTE
MPQWIELPPNLVPSTQTYGKSIYATDYSSKRPGFQIHLQKAARGSRSFHHPRVPKDPNRSSMRASQTGNYMSFKDEYDKNLAKKTGKTTLSLQYKTPREETPESKGSEVYREVLSEYVKPSLNLVRQAWKGETSAVKRDRDRMYGLSGKKVVMIPGPPKFEEGKKTPTGRILPGMKSWLTKSNEYEKAVVYNFMDHVAKATTKRPDFPTRPSTPQPTKSTFANEYFYKQRTNSAQSQRVTERMELPPRPKTVHSFRNEANEATEEQMKQDEQPKEHAHEHGSHVHHTEGKCDYCDYMRVKKLLEYLNRHDPHLGEATLRHLLRPRVYPTHTYPSYED